MIELGKSFLQYPVTMEQEKIANSFGKMLNFHSDIRKLAITTLLSISRFVAISLDPKVLIECLVLSRASQFTGVGQSSFSWNIAL